MEATELPPHARRRIVQEQCCRSVRRHISRQRFAAAVVEDARVQTKNVRGDAFGDDVGVQQLVALADVDRMIAVEEIAPGRRSSPAWNGERRVGVGSCVCEDHVRLRASSSGRSVTPSLQSRRSPEVGLVIISTKRWNR